METIGQDLRYALRQLRKSPGFTVVAVLNSWRWASARTQLYSAWLMRNPFLSPLTYKNADSLVMVWQQNPHRGWSQNNVSGANFLDWKKQNHVFTDIACLRIRNSFNLSGGAKPERSPQGERVTTNLFSVLEGPTLARASLSS